jgi:hypothetical protein
MQDFCSLICIQECFFEFHENPINKLLIFRLTSFFLYPYSFYTFWQSSGCGKCGWATTCPLASFFFISFGHEKPSLSSFLSGLQPSLFAVAGHTHVPVTKKRNYCIMKEVYFPKMNIFYNDCNLPEYSSKWSPAEHLFSINSPSTHW